MPEKWMVLMIKVMISGVYQHSGFRQNPPAYVHGKEY